MNWFGDARCWKQLAVVCALAAILLACGASDEHETAIEDVDDAGADAVASGVAPSNPGGPVGRSTAPLDNPNSARPFLAPSFDRSSARPPSEEPVPKPTSPSLPRTSCV